jgi:hypothetical protein
VAAPPPPPPPPGPPRLAPPTILSDERYSALERVFVPQLYGPTFAVMPRAIHIYGLLLEGGDRLERHRWLLAGYYQLESSLFSFAAAYMNRQLAPYTVTLSAAQIKARDIPERAPGSDPVTSADFVLLNRTRTASLDVTRTFFGNPVTLGGMLIESHRPNDLDFPFVDRRLAGPHLSAAYAGTETTPYTGVRRQLFLGTDLALYPRQWSTLPWRVFDARGELAVTTPLPLARRQTLTLNVRGRDLVGPPRSAPMLQVGGFLPWTLWSGANRPESSELFTPFLPTGMPFFEPLRGFEDHPLAGNRVAIADLTYRYRFIVDWGTASTFGLLPAFFLRQLDLSLFGTAARVQHLHGAAGAALFLRIAVGPVPFSVMYQIARRLTDDEGLAHVVALTL